MKIIFYSDLHLEFAINFRPPADSDADLMILAGDIITCKDYTPLSRFLENWQKQVLYVMGNHEYYTPQPMSEVNRKFRQWLTDTHPNVSLLLDEAITLDGVHFFGGTMWTNFKGSNSLAMGTAQKYMNDFYKIFLSDGQPLTPTQTITLHQIYKDNLTTWFENNLSGTRVVISHHAPVINPNTKHKHSPLQPAFNSLDMLPLIEQYQPALWVYGHTHECDDQMIGETRVMSNQSGYPGRLRKFECADFDVNGQAIRVA